MGTGGGSDGMSQREEARGEHQDGAQQRDDRFCENAHETKGKKGKPDERIENQGNQRDWPAQDKKDAPEQEADKMSHDVLPFRSEFWSIIASNWPRHNDTRGEGILQRAAENSVTWAV